MSSCTLVGYYAVCGGNSLPTFRDIVQSSRVEKSKKESSWISWSMKMWPIGCPETSVITTVRCVIFRRAKNSELHRFFTCYSKYPCLFVMCILFIRRVVPAVWNVRMVYVVTSWQDREAHSSCAIRKLRIREASSTRH